MREPPSDHEDRIRALEDAGGGGGVTDHGALTGLADDDHTQYQLESEKGAANGYAGLDAGGLVAFSDLPTGTGASEVAIGNHTHAGGSYTPDVTYWTLSSTPQAIGEVDGEISMGNWTADTDVPAYFTQGTGMSAATTVFTGETAGMYRATFCVFMTPDAADYAAAESFRVYAYFDLDAGANGPGYNYMSMGSKELQVSDNPLGVTLTGAVDLPIDVDTTVELKFAVFGVSSDVSVTGAYVSFTRMGDLA